MIDCDVHVRWSSLEQIAPYFDEPWRSQLMKGRRPFGWNGYHSPLGSWRKDANPPGGGQAGTDPHFIIEDLIDRFGIEYAVLFGESSHLALSNLTGSDWPTAVAKAYNEWLINDWFSVDPRFLGTVFIAPQDPLEAAKEIDRVGGHPQFVQVGFGTGSQAPYGQKQFHPILEAAERNNLAIAVHIATEGAGTSYPPTSAGYPSFYVEWKILHTATLKAHMASMIFEGVFEKFPKLKLILVEGGIGWVPETLWKMDQNWKAMQTETPWVKRKPSEYATEHVRLTTQPIEESENPEHIKQMLGMFPADQMLLFSSDYPHWDFDSPEYVKKLLPDSIKDRVLSETARELYGLPKPLSVAT